MHSTPFQFVVSLYKIHIYYIYKHKYIHLYAFFVAKIVIYLYLKLMKLNRLRLARVKIADKQTHAKKNEKSSELLNLTKWL